MIENLEEEDVVGKTGGPVSSSTVHCSHFTAPTLQSFFSSKLVEHRTECETRFDMTGWNLFKWEGYKSLV